MKAVRAGDGQVHVIDVDEPPGAGEPVQVRAAGICGSDLSYVRWGMQRILGHELAGVRPDGRAVMVEALYGCGECAQCLAGRDNLCPTHGERALGVSADGGMVEQFLVPERRLLPLPDGLDVRDASLVEPASVAWHALRLAGTGPQARVLVIGGGALGLLGVAAARAMGAAEVALDARHPHQRTAGERLGAQVGATGQYDVVLDAAGSPSALAQATELVARRGTIVSVAIHLGTVDLPWMPLFNKEARLLPSLGYAADVDGRREMENAAAMLAADPDIAPAVITHRFPLVDAVEAFRVAADRASGALKVVLEP